jgi:hemerythrin-like domain-containing protein
MQRSPALQPLSREHHSALKLAQACERAAGSSDAGEVERACRRAIAACASELKAHFETEEQALLPLLAGTPEQPLAERTRAEHRQLYAMLDDLKRNDVATLDRFGKCLAAHVRFEERELFPALEANLSARPEQSE